MCVWGGGGVMIFVSEKKNFDEAREGKPFEYLRNKAYGRKVWGLSANA